MLKCVHLHKTCYAKLINTSKHFYLGQVCFNAARVNVLLWNNWTGATWRIV